MNKVNDTLNDRESKYGSWTRNATTAQALKQLMRTGANWPKLLAHQRESLDMIATKIGRILSGDPNNVDSWHDIGGYAALSEREITPPKKTR